MSSQKTSATAFAIVCGMAKLASQTRWQPYFPDEMVALNRAFIRHCRDTLTKHLMSACPPRMFAPLMDIFYIPGMAYHFLFRKRLVESLTRKALADGVRQVIVLGAGLDTLAVRLAKEYPGVRFFELDLPNTQQTKTGVLDHMCYPVPSNCIFIPVDLSQATLESALCGKPRVDANAPTLVILEGVLMYLEEAEVKALFKALYGVFQSKLTVVFGAIAAPDSTANWRVRLTNFFLRTGGNEETKWHCASGDMLGSMAALGFTLKEWMPYRKLQEYYRSEQEIRAIPEEDENYYVVAKMMQTGSNESVCYINQIPFILVNN